MFCHHGAKNSRVTNFTVSYNSSNHFSVLTQCLGSVWPKVFPFCLFNVLVGLVLWYFVQDKGVDFHITEKGHRWLTLVVAFLIVSRANVSIGRYNQARGYLSTMMLKGREIIHNMAILSSDNTDEKGKAWRHEMSYVTMMLIRTSMTVIDYENDKVPSWELEEMDEAMREQMKKYLFLSPETMKFAHHSVIAENEENMRVPIRMAMILRQTLRSARKKLTKPFPTIDENKLLGAIDGFMNGYYGIRKFLTTPFPFPMVQMSRTFLFLYVFTLPFALLTDNANIYVHSVILFFVTYGFMGLEYVAMELDNPFGTDANDFNNLRLARVAFEDTYLTIWEMDGDQWTDKLRLRMNDPVHNRDLPVEAAAWLLPEPNDAVV